jgi:beta-phosphoglucomutase family hydrolase
MIEAVLFDMDGVIIDSEPIHINNNYEIFRSLGITLTEELNCSFIGTNSRYKWALVKSKYDIPFSVEELIELDRSIYFQYLNKNKNAIEPIPGVLDFIKDLKNNNIRLAIASSAPINVIDTVLDMFHITDFFDVVVTGDDVKRSKPEPDIFIYAANKLHVKNENCMVVEDSTNGITAAKKANMKCLGFINPSSLNQDVSEADINTSLFQSISYKTIMKALYKCTD